MVEQSPNMADAFDDAWSISKNEMSTEQNDEYHELMEALENASYSLSKMGLSDFMQRIDDMKQEILEELGEPKDPSPRGSPYTMGLA